MMKIEIYGIRLPEIKKGDNIGKIICENFKLKDGDIVVVTSKIVSKAEGRYIKLDEIKVSKDAEKIAEKVGKDAKIVEIILRLSKIVGTIPLYRLVVEGIIDLKDISKSPQEALKLIEKDKCLLITLIDNQIYTDAGIDFSNCPLGYVCLPPEDPMRSAKKIREEVKECSSKNVAVLISDTEVFFGGSLEVCRGYAGICPTKREFAAPDIYGRLKYGGAEALVHEICNAASLVMGQTTEKVPVAVVRGVIYEDCKVKDIDYKKALKIIAKENAKLIGTKSILKFIIDLMRGSSSV